MAPGLVLHMRALALKWNADVSALMECFDIQPPVDSDETWKDNNFEEVCSPLDMRVCVDWRPFAMCCCRLQGGCFQRLCAIPSRSEAWKSTCPSAGWIYSSPLHTQLPTTLNNNPCHAKELQHLTKPLPQHIAPVKMVAMGLQLVPNGALYLNCMLMFTHKTCSGHPSKPLVRRAEVQPIMLSPQLHQRSIHLTCLSPPS